MVNPKWNGPIAMAFAMVATAAYMTYQHGCFAGSGDQGSEGAPVPRPRSTPPVVRGAAEWWCAGETCRDTLTACEAARQTMRSPPDCARTSSAWCYRGTCFRSRSSCEYQRDLNVSESNPLPPCAESK